MRRLAALGLLFAACSYEVEVGRPRAGLAPPDAAADGPPACNTSRKLDLLFVLDDSASMAPKQDELARHFELVAGALGELPGGLPDLHLAVVSSDLGAGGRGVPGCEGEGDRGVFLRGDACLAGGRFLRDLARPDGTRDRNFTGPVWEAVRCLVRLDPGGCGFEQPMAAMRRALDRSNPENEGFLRDDALLAVVFLSDEDDCSAADPALFDPAAEPLGPLSSFRCTEHGVRCDGAPVARAPASYQVCEPRRDGLLVDPATYAAHLRTLKPRVEQLVLAAFVGPPAPFSVEAAPSGPVRLAPSCATETGGALPGVRFRDLLARFSDATAWGSLCDGVRSTSEALGRTLHHNLLEHCWSPAADAGAPDGPAPAAPAGRPLDPQGCAAARGAPAPAGLALLLLLVYHRRCHALRAALSRSRSEAAGAGRLRDRP